MRRLFLTLLLCWPLLRAEIVDRIAIVVDRSVITDAQIDEEVRVTGFLNREPLNGSVEARRAAADRLIEQALVRREMALSHYSEPTTAETDAMFNAARNQAGGAAALHKALAAYGLNEDILRAHLRSQVMLLRFIDFRFRPDVEISDTDVRTYYQQEVEKSRASHTAPPPSIEENRAAIEKALTSDRIDYALSSWLEEARKQVDILYMEKGLQ